MDNRFQYHAWSRFKTLPQYWERNVPLDTPVEICSLHNVHVKMFVRVFRSNQKSQTYELLALGLLWANLDHYDARFSKFRFLRILGAFFVFFQMGFFVFFSKISAILTPRTMKFGHKDYFYTKKWHKKNFRKISFFKAFFRCFLNSQIKKWCVCSRFPQSLNIRAA